MWEKGLPKPPQSQDININSVVQQPGRLVSLQNCNGWGLKGNIVAECGHGR